MDFNKAALEMHETHHGKVGIVSKVEVKTRDDLSTAYTPGVAEPCRKIKENPDDVYKYTFKGNMVAVVSNGTAVLGLGDIGPEAGLPVMEGKAVLFKEFGGVDAFPICIDAHDAASVIAACKAIAPTFGGINLEDIKSPECFEIEETLERELDIPVFHDDQHGTAIVVTAAGVMNDLNTMGNGGHVPKDRFQPHDAVGIHGGHVRGVRIVTACHLHREHRQHLDPIGRLAGHGDGIIIICRLQGFQPLIEIIVDLRHRSGERHDARLPALVGKKDAEW